MKVVSFIWIFIAMLMLLFLASCGSDSFSSFSSLDTPRLTTVKTGFKKVLLSWTPVPKASEYIVYMAETPDGPYTQATSVENNESIINSLQNGKEYYFKVKAKNSNGSSPLTDAVSAIPEGISNPYVAKKALYKGQLHLHTNHSDGVLSPEKMITIYKEAGYDFIAFTDHDKVTIVPKAYGVLIIPGIEISSPRGHVSAIMSQSLLTSNSAKDMIKEVMAMNGILSLCHPNLQNESLFLDNESDNIQSYKIIEVYNAVAEHLKIGSGNAEDKWDMLLSKGLRIFGVAVDDAHTLSHVNYAWVYVNADSLSVEDIIQALRTGNFIATTGPDLTITVNGDIVSAATTMGASIEFITAKGIVMKSANNVLSADYTVGGDEVYVRIRVTRQDGRMAWSNPLFIP
jgi:hypothetical protein